MVYYNFSLTVISIRYDSPVVTKVIAEILEPGDLLQQSPIKRETQAVI